jgi:DNA-binding HxlR family transcriptional regulator
MLTERLRELEAAGVITRHVGGGPPIAVTYALADEAGELRAALQSLRSWAASKAS